MNVVDSSTWLEFFADGPNAGEGSGPGFQVAKMGGAGEADNVTLLITDKEIILLDVGSHDEVYH